ncbi:BRCA1-associated RING domain protein 1-like [Bidens hawaiensis]|uniref:BRCA1-associated RING domain protein 1-like n=1 Tax=Bidens hawaiensis TaxID=980011 RepID=UPI004049D1E2
MEEAQRLINPWVLHLQKLGLELKCPICLQLFNRPVLLPCNHIFCSSCQIGSECAVCKHSCVDKEVKSAPFMENIVTIFRNIEATLSTNVIHPVCSDMGKSSAKSPASLKIDINNSLTNENAGITKEGNSSNDQSTTLQTDVPNLTFDSLENLEKCITPESVKRPEFKISGVTSKVLIAPDNQLENGVGFTQIEKVSPPLLKDSKDVVGNCGVPKSNHKNLIKYSLKRRAENDASGAKSHTSEGKRQKETDDMKMEPNHNLDTSNVSSENAATASCNSETESKKPVSDVQKDQPDLKNNPCAFCQCSKETEGSGALVAYAHGKEVNGNVSNFAKVTYVHVKCTEWAPQIYFQKGMIKNLESEVSRAGKLKCASCGKKGAVLGCYMKSCQRTYHVPCAYDISECRWDCEDFLLLCPTHESHKFPKEKSKAVKQNTNKKVSKNLNHCTTLLNGGKNLVLCGSALSSEQKLTMFDFARTNGSSVSKCWKDNVTHVIAATDSKGACTRTLKVLMAILNGKWIVTIEWLKACVVAGRVVNEEPYEVGLDTHGCSGGPAEGRLRVLNNAPKLFNNMKFYFVGDYVQAFKNDLLNLVKTAGGIIGETKDELDQEAYVVYNADMSFSAEVEGENSIKSRRLDAAESVAQEYGSGSRVVEHTWILESIAACSLVPVPSRV